MKPNRSARRGSRGARPSGLRILCAAALLSALSIVLGKYLAINVTDSIRLSFENLTILMAGIFFGPLVGAAVGAAADLLGCMLVGYAINPLVTLGAGCIGLLGGLLFRVSGRLSLLWQCFVTVLGTHLIASVLIKTVGLAAYYPEMPFHILLLWRLLNYTVVALAEWLLLYTILKNQALRHRLEALRQ
jgi:ECF transporter S component (folate family)